MTKHAWLRWQELWRRTKACAVGDHELIFCEGFPTLAEDCWRCRHCTYADRIPLTAGWLRLTDKI